MAKCTERSTAWPLGPLHVGAAGRDGHIQIGDREGFGFVVRALDYGGIAFEDDRLVEAMAALEIGLRKWFKKQGIEIEGRR